MIRLTILDQDGKVLLPKDVATAAELLTLVEQARTVIRDCENLARLKSPKNSNSGPSTVPYLT